MNINKSIKKDRNVTYTFEEEGFKYEDNESDALDIKWEDCNCLLIMEHGMYIIPNSDKDGALIGIPIEYKDQVTGFLKEKDIELEIVK